MPNQSFPTIAVIGAGMAGLACARALQNAGARPVVLDKGRGPGGRLATRRLDGGIRFDHGAQYVTAHGAVFRSTLAAIIESGAAAQWRPATTPGIDPAAEDWITGTPGMNALVEPLAAGLELRAACEVTAVEREGAGWRVRTAGNVAGEFFDIVVSTVPVPQARQLFGAERDIAQALDGVTMAPCWALMLLFAAPVAGVPDVLQTDPETLSWLGRNNSKPGRDAARECWVAHATADWSSRHLELEREPVAVLLVEAVRRILGNAMPRVGQAIAHRWRYARTVKALGRPCLASRDGRLFLGGDWALGARVECAFDSGHAIAQTIIDGRWKP
ncbi:MAG: FAD-dependent oxidoreductase [Burkholderiales bacterium]|nr:FAD-dependent oxidoreductase [Burkholderiales bacterium]